MACAAPWARASPRTGVPCCQLRTIPGVSSPWGYKPLLFERITDGSWKNVSSGKCLSAITMPRSGIRVEVDV